MSSGQIKPECDVAIVGGGTAGLALAAELKRQGIGDVVVLEREKSAGGIPLHCGHYPFGVREYRRLMKGPDYARKNVSEAQNLGVEIHTETTVTALHPGGRLSLSTALGTTDLQARRVVLCTGVRESSRAQRFIGGDRPQGVLTTGALQSMVYLQGLRPFRRPVILGSELVSFSAIDTCRHLGIRPVAMVEENHRIMTYDLLRAYNRLRGVPLHLGANEPRIFGRDRVEALELTDATGARKRIETDGVIISGRFRPEAALLRQSHLEVDSGTGGPVIDQYGQCSDPAYYSAGNLLRPAETSGYCWREGVEAARRIAHDLAGHATSQPKQARLQSTDPAIGFVLPQRIGLTDRPGGMDKMQIGLNEPVKGILEAKVGGEAIWQARINARPVRRIQMPLAAILQVRPKATVNLSIKKEP